MDTQVHQQHTNLCEKMRNEARKESKRDLPCGDLFEQPSTRNSANPTSSSTDKRGNAHYRPLGQRTPFCLEAILVRVSGIHTVFRDLVDENKYPSQPKPLHNIWYCYHQEFIQLKETYTTHTWHRHPHLHSVPRSVPAPCRASTRR